MNQNVSFGNFVRQRRREMDLTQDELARRVGCATITLRKIEADDLRASVQIAERLAMALAIPLDERGDFVRRARAVRPDAGELPLDTPAPSIEEIGREDLTGRAIRGYALAERIGMGGMGTVYRAVQPNVEREVAIKIILPAFANHPDFIRRFEAEAQLVARLEHPHIVPLYDYWREPGVAYLVMRLLRGGNVQGLLAQGALPISMTTHFLDQICSALHAAHRLGVIHRDLKPANVLLDEDRNAYLADFGLAKNLGNPDFENQTQVDAIIGSPQYMSPEQIRSLSIGPQTDIYCLGVMLYEMLTGVLPFTGPTPFDMIQQHINTPMPSLSAHYTGLPAALDKVIQRATAKDPQERYQDALALYDDFRLAMDGGIDLHPAAISYEEERYIETTNPFKGLRPFVEADAEDFFGRETLVQQLLARLGEGGDLRRFLAVIGPSGSGKSSVVRAGLVPAIRRGGLPGSENWFIVDMLPGRHPFEELEASLLRVAVNPPESLLSQLKDGNRGLLRAVQRILPADESVELVLVIDQFEEVFTLVEDEAERALLLESLAAAVLDERSRLRVVITLRADFTDKPLRYVDFGELMNRRFEFVLPLTADEVERAVAGPAQRVGLRLEKGLVSTILRDAGNQPGTLPLLQYALSELFEKRDGRALTNKAYHDIGGVLGALGRSAEAVFVVLDEVAQFAARQLFLRLVTLGEGTEDTRRRVLRTEVENLAMKDGRQTVDHGSLSEVVEAFGKARLLTYDRDPLTRGATIEVAHEALLREWTRLREWLNDSRADVRLQRLLAHAANEWEEAGREPSFLLTGSRLGQFEGWVTTTTIVLIQDERSFLEASLVERDRRETEERARGEHELEAARKLADSERRAARRLRRRAYLLGGAFALAVVLAGVALFFGRQANQNAARAEQNAIAAQQNAAAARNAEATARAESDRAGKAAHLATARELALASINNLDVDAERSILLALQAVSEAKAANAPVPFEVQDALHRAIQDSRIRYTLTSHEGGMESVDFSPDGKLLATTGSDGTARIWEAATGKELAVLRGPEEGGTWVARFSPDGKVLATAGEDQAVRVWDVANRQVFRTLDGFAGTIWNISFSSDGQLLAAGGDNKVMVWDVNTEKELKTLEGQTGPVVFSPVGGQLAMRGSDKTTEVWDVDTWEKQFSLPSEPNALAFSPDGKRLAIAYMDLKVWDLSTRQQLVSTPGFAAMVRGLEFSPDGSQIAAGGQDGTLSVWDAQSGTRLFSMAGHAAAIEDVSYNPECSAPPDAPFDSCGRWLASAGRDGTARVWDVSPVGSREVATLPGPGLGFYENKHLFTDSFFDGYRQADHQTWEISSTGDSNWLSSTILSLLPAVISAGNSSPDGTRVLLADTDGTLRAWDAITGEPLLSFVAGDPETIGSVAMSADNRQIATGNLDGTAKIWSAVTGQELLTLVGHTKMVGSMAFSPDGTRILTGSDDNTAKVWDATNGKLLQTLAGHKLILYAVAFSPDGKRIATASMDLTSKIWDTDSGENLLTLVGHTASVASLAFSPDGSRLATGSYDGTARVWDVSGDASAGKELLRLTGHEGEVAFVSFSPDGKLLATGSFSDGTVRVYALDVEELVALARSRLTRSFTLQECQEYLHLAACP